MTIRDLIEMGANLDTPIYIHGFVYDYKGTGNLVARYGSRNGIITALITEDNIELCGDLDEYKVDEYEADEYEEDWEPRAEWAE